MSTTRNVIPGIVLRPEVHKISNNKLNWYATRYIIYKDRARLVKEFDDTFTGNSKESFSYSKEFTDDRVLFFTTNIQLSDGTWCGESPLTPVILRKTRVSSSGIIITPEIATTKVDNSLILKGSEYIRYEGQALHYSSDWIIEDDITGEVKLKREKDREHLTELKIDKIDLDPNRPYRVKARYEDVLGKTSNYGSCLLITGTILDDLIPNDLVRIYYGNSIKIETEKNLEYIVNSDQIEMNIYKNNNLVNTIKYDKGFFINSLDYALGDTLKAIATYGDVSKQIEILILNKDIETGDIDPTFDIKGLYKNLDASSFLINGVSTSKQMDDGYIYDIDPVSKKLVRIEYDDVLSMIYKKEEVLDLSSIGVNDLTYRAIHINPFGGLVLFFSQSSYEVNTTATQKIVFVSILDSVFTIEKIVSIDHNSFGCTHNNNTYVDGNNLVVYNKIYYDNRTMIRIYSVDLLNRTVSDNGIINKDYIFLNGYAPIKINGEVLMVKSGVETEDLSYRNIRKACNINHNSHNYHIEDNWIYTISNTTLYKIDILTGKEVVLYTGLLLDGYGGIRRSKINNKLYFTPYKAQNVMVVDPNKNDEVKFLTNATHIPASALEKWYMWVEAENGKLYASPYGQRSILILDPSNDSFSSVAITATPTNGVSLDGVYADGSVYFSPNQDNRIISINTTTNVVTYTPVPGLAIDQLSYGRGSYYHPSKKLVYFNPYSKKDILTIDIVSKAVRVIPIPTATNNGYNRHVNMGLFSENKIWMGASSIDGCIRLLDVDTEQIDDIIIARANDSVFGSLYIPNQMRFVSFFSNTAENTKGLISTYLPDTIDNSKILKNSKGSLSIKKEIPNPITVVNAPLISRLVKLKNNKPAFILAPSTENNKAGIVEINPTTFELLDKRVDLTGTSNHRIVYTLKDGRIITANNNKAVLFY